ncbi:MAG: SRPBCC family protein [Archangiaceae bacterium]|nr:SRPBCC family protein [Archangiaceae bacterium]
MAKKILAVVAVLVVAFLGFVATRPSEFTISRSASLAAPQPAVHALVNDFHQWARWSPWDQMDPSMKREYSGPASGVGSSYAWSGNDKVGEGRMTILGSTPEKIEIKLEFIKPFAATNVTAFSFAPEGAGTKVQWSMNGHNNFMAKGFGVFMDMDKLVGADFEKGLASMATAAQADAKAGAAAAAEPAPGAAPAQQ